MSVERFKPMPYEPDLPFDWQTGGRQLSEEELKIERRLVKIDKTEKLSTDNARNPLMKQWR